MCARHGVAADREGDRVSERVHTSECVANAAVSVRENCASQLTAEPWDASAWRDQEQWVYEWALEWVADGTSDCVCARGGAA